MENLFLMLLSPTPVRKAVQLTREGLAEARELAIRRGLLMLLHKRLLDNIGFLEPNAEVEKFIEELRPLRYGAIVRAIRQETVGMEISELLRREGVQAMVIRGNAIARELYGEPYCRVSSDIDLLIKRSDLSRADSVLTGNGCQRHDPLPLVFWLNRIHHAVYVHPDAADLIEVHWNFGIPSYFRLSSEDIWKEVTSDGSGQGRLSMEMELIQLLIHHHMHAFREFRILVDILWTLHKYDKTIDWRAFVLRLREVGLLNTAMITLIQINNVWENPNGEIECINTLGTALKGMGYDKPGYLSSYFRMEFRRDPDFQSPGDKFMSRLALDSTGTVLFSFIKSLFPSPEDIKALYGDRRNWSLPYNYLRFIAWRLTDWKR